MIFWHALNGVYHIPVGLAEGAGVGDVVGLPVGRPEGAVVGTAVGSAAYIATCYNRGLWNTNMRS
jgi:hypothetical protein